MFAFESCQAADAEELCEARMLFHRERVSGRGDAVHASALRAIFADVGFAAAEYETLWTRGDVSDDPRSANVCSWGRFVQYYHTPVGMLRKHLFFRCERTAFGAATARILIPA